MNTTLGIDIGTKNIRLVELGKDSAGPVLLAAGSIPTPPKALSSTLAADAEALVQTITQLFRETGVKSRVVNIALPEAQVFTRVIEMPPLSPRELTSALQWEAEQYIPLPLDQVNIDFSVLRQAKDTGTGKIEVLLVACPKTLLDKYVSYFDAADITVDGVETDIIATARALTQSTSTIRTAMIVSLGSQTTDVAILRSGTLSFTRSISAGGDALTRAIAQGLNFEQGQAEEYKNTYGLEQDKLEGKIVAAAKPVMDTIIGELRRAIAFYLERYKNEPVEAILLSGDTAKLPGMVVYLAENVGSSIEVQLANPWVGIKKDPRFNALNTEGPSFAVSVGLALR